MEWISDYAIEIFGAVTGILYVFLEVRQNLWLWPVGIITSGVYIIVFFTGKLYAEMGLQVYYLVISMIGWYWWIKGAGRRAQGSGQKDNCTIPELRENSVNSVVKKESGSGHQRDDGLLQVTRLKLRTGIMLLVVFLLIYWIMWYLLDRYTDSPVPAADSFITSLSIIATWMLARKIYEHWYLWLVVNSVSAVLFFSRDLYATVILYIVYFIMSFAGLKAWKKDLPAVSK